MAPSPTLTSGGDADDLAFDADAIEQGRLLFARECRFVMGATDLAALPDAGLPEIAFAGRSNVGKSSLVNALTGRTTLARTSNTPGRTQQLNFFVLGEQLMLVDLPGYGYARVSKRQVKEWTALVVDYLRGRPVLQRVCLLIDARHGPKDSDRDFMTMLDEAAVSYQVVLTKADKVGAEALAAECAAIEKELASRAAAHPQIIVTSARTGDGIDTLRAAIARLAATVQTG